MTDRNGSPRREKRVLRPPMMVLPDDALIPPECLVSPPDVFTHVLTRRQPYWFDWPARDPRGELSPGARVVLVADERAGSGKCRVVDAQGLRVWVDCDSLAALTPGDRGP